MSRDRLIGGPAIIYVAATGTAKPLVEAAPASTWSELGLKQYGDDIDLALPQSMSPERIQGETYPIKHFRSEENATLSVQLKNMDLNVLKYALNNQNVTRSAPSRTQVGRESLDLERGLVVATIAILLRFVSPFNPDWNLQVYMPQSAIGGDLEFPFRKSQATMYTAEFMAEKHPTLGAIHMDVQYAAVTP